MSIAWWHRFPAPTSSRASPPDLSTLRPDSLPSRWPRIRSAVLVAALTRPLTYDRSLREQLGETTPVLARHDAVPQKRVYPAGTADVT
jgi:hypothetical protein